MRPALVTALVFFCACSEPDADLTCQWFHDDNCWKTAVEEITACVPGASAQGLLSEDRTSCAYPDGTTMDLDLPSDENGGVSAAGVHGTDAVSDDGGRQAEGEGVEGVAGAMLEGTHLDEAAGSDEPSRSQPMRRKRPGLMIGFDNETGGEDMAWLRGSTLYINALHPAYRRVRGTAGASLYITFVVASTLSGHIQEGRPPYELMQRFMAAWGGMK